MHNFSLSLPTVVHFGEGQISKLAQELKQYGNTLLLVYGGGSIKRNGVYDAIVEICDAQNIRCIELSGVDPNPRLTTVEEGAALCKEHDVDMILAAGGGSTIDCAKAIAAAAKYDGDLWDMVLNPNSITDALPLLTVLTLSATGSETNTTSVISNMDSNDKVGFGNPHMLPKCSILDPTYTYSVSKYQTASGVADIMSHIFEVYFTRITDAILLDRVCEAMLKTCIECGPVAIEEPENYTARANLMWTSSWAINGWIASAKGNAWSCHAMEHPLSAYYDIAHGVGLAILTPHWMRYILSEDTVEKFAEYGKNVWNIDATLDPFEIANKAIDQTEDFFKALGIPMTLTELEIDSSLFDEMAEKAAVGLSAAYVPLTKEDVIKIYETSL